MLQGQENKNRLGSEIRLLSLDPVVKIEHSILLHYCRIFQCCFMTSDITLLAGPRAGHYTRDLWRLEDIAFLVVKHILSDVHKLCRDHHLSG